VVGGLPASVGVTAEGVCKGRKPVVCRAALRWGGESTGTLQLVGEVAAFMWTIPAPRPRPCRDEDKS